MRRVSAKYTLLFVSSFLLLAAYLSARQNVRPDLWGYKAFRSIAGGSQFPPAEGYRHSPFLLDGVLGTQQLTVRLFANDVRRPLDGPGSECWRFFADGPGQLVVTFAMNSLERTPRIWLYNDANRMLPGGQRDVRGQEIRQTFEIPEGGLYLLRCRFFYEDVRSISITGQTGERQLALSDYVSRNVKELHLSVSENQLARLREIEHQLKDHWKQVDARPPNRWLPSPKERIVGRLRTKAGDWAFASFSFSGRNSQHSSRGALPSLDVKVESGSLPFGVSEFKLYTLESKTGGRDMIFESLIEDHGLAAYREDVVKVFLNGRHVGFAQFMEGVTSAFFEYAQRQEGALVGYDTDALIARRGRSRFEFRNYFKKASAAGVADLTQPAFNERVSRNPMATALSFTSAYAGRHGMGNDARFHVNNRTGSHDPVVKDFNSGVDAVRSKHDVIPALRTLATMAPDWRPNVATYSSYFVHRHADRDDPLPFFWWNVLPTNLEFFRDRSGFEAAVRFLKKWDSPESRERVSQRLRNLALVADELDHRQNTRLRAEINAAPVPLLQDAIPCARFEDLLDKTPEYLALPSIRYVARLLHDVSRGELRPSGHSLAAFAWRNELVSRMLSPASSGDLRRSLGSNPAVTFLFRQEMEDTAHFVFLGRNPDEQTGPESFYLVDEQGTEHHATRSLAVGTKQIPTEYVRLLLNDVTPDERVRVWHFRIPRAKEYGYFRPAVRGRCSYVGPMELAVHARPQQRPTVPASVPLRDYLTGTGKELRWRKDAPRLDGHLVIPAGTTWAVTEPLELKFGKGAALFIHGNLRIAGGAKLHLTAAEDSWQGIHFHDCPDLVIENLTVEKVGTRAAASCKHPRVYTGAVTFFECNVKLKNCEIRNIRCEDGLHFLRSEVELEDCRLHNTWGDAIDADFCNLRIRRLHCTAAGVLSTHGGDALDVSGSYAEVSDCLLETSSDKGLSCGENARVVATNCRLVNGVVGVGLKDGSDLTLRECTIRGNTVGINTYVKKPCYPLPSLKRDRATKLEKNLQDVGDTMIAPPTSKKAAG